MKTKHMAKSILALVLTVCMVVGILPVSAFAAGGSISVEKKATLDTNEDGFIDYVSLGDSLTAGFGMDGYYAAYDPTEPYEIPAINDVASFSPSNPYGYGKQVTDTYIYLLNEYFNGDDLTHWNQMAISSMRIEEFTYMLKDGNWPMDGLTGDSYKDMLVQQAGTIKSALANAEVISMKLGDYSLSSALNGRMRALLDPSNNGGGTYDDMNTAWLFSQFPEYAYLQGYYDQLAAIIGEELKASLGDRYGQLGADAVDGMVYYALSYVISYDEAMKVMRELNPQAQIIVIGMTNFMDGIVLNIDEDTTVDFGQLFQIVVDFVNLHRATVAGSSDYLFVSIPQNLQLMTDDFAAGQLQDSSVLRLLAAVIRDFGVASMTGGQLNEDELLKVWMTLYLNNKGSDTTNDVLLPGIEDTIQGGIATAKKVKTLLNGMFDVLQYLCTKPDSYSMNALNDALAGVSYDNGNGGTGMMAYVSDAILAALDADDPQSIPEGVHLLAYLYLRCIVGEGLLGHPGVTGHTQVYNAIVTTIENNVTGKDFVVEYAKSIYQLVLTYGPDALQAAYIYADQNGYLEDYHAFRADLLANINDWEALVVAAGNDPDALKAAANTIASDLVNLMRQYGLDAMAVQIANYLDMAMNYLKPYLDEIVFKLQTLLALYGSQAIQSVIDYVDATGYIQMAQDKYNQLMIEVEKWKTEIASLTPAVLAEKIVNYLITNGCLTQAQLDEALAFVNQLNDLYNSLQGMTKEMFIEKFTQMLQAYGPQAFDMLKNHLADLGYLDIAQNVVDKLLLQIPVWKDAYENLAGQLNGITEESLKVLADEVLKYLVETGILPADQVNDAITWLDTEVKAYITALEATIQDLIAKAEAAGQIAKETITHITAKINELKNFVDAYPESVNALIAQLIKTATTTDYIIDGEECYLALGGKTVFGANVDNMDPLYYELIAEELGWDFNAKATNGYIQDNLAYLSGLADEIAKATLITYQQDADTFLYSAIYATPDWTKYLSDEEIAYAQQIIAKAIEKLPADVDRKVIEIVQPLIQNAVYGAVEYAVGTIQGIEYINTINPEVAIILPGMYNPVRGLQADINGTLIDLSMIFDYIVEATNIYYIACGNLYDNVTFVDVSDADTIGYHTTISIEEANLSELADLLMGTGMYATAQGHVYIYEQIMAAVNFVLEYDVNLDGVFDILDVAYLYNCVLGQGTLGEDQYAVSDVNEDGVIDVLDVALLYAKLKNIAVAAN